MYDASNLRPIAADYIVPVEVARSMDMSVLAEQVFCSIVAELQTRWNVRELPLWSTLMQANHVTSYCRSTACGHLRRLVWHTQSDVDELLVLTIACMVEAKANDKVALQALADLDEHPDIVGDGAGDYVSAALKWHARRRSSLKQAALGLKATVPGTVWERGLALASN